MSGVRESKRSTESLAGFPHPIEEVRAALQGLSSEKALLQIDQAQDDLRALRFEVLAETFQKTVADVRPSPAVAAGVAASQRLLDRLEEREDTRLLSASQMAEYAQKSRNWAAESAREGRLIRAEHAGKIVYPAFQVDAETRTVHSWVSEMVPILADLGLDGRSFTVWAASDSPRFGGEMPALHASDSNFLSIAAGSLATL